MSIASASPSSVLLVEDEALVRMFVVDELADAGFLVLEATTAAEALALIEDETRSIQAAIIDIGLPDGRGDDLASTIRDRKVDLPIVMASGHDEGMIRARFASDSRIVVLTKPYDVAHLCALLRDLGVV